MAIQLQQQRQRQAAAALPPLRAALALAGASDLAVDLDQAPDVAVAIGDRLRQLPEAERRRLLATVGAVAVALTGFINALIVAGRSTAAVALLQVLLTLLMLRNALEDSLRK
jgi:hypothetical protein